ncbi:nitrogen permease regulator 2-domain-containing protein [Neurospora tetraspora]|uniref:Nitrogen permease regulator 2-domain-containing protein n=1 Tax=Neurospora tetraspora TaxID=94610 RepID=A0AAE0MXG1_9PEZI|nr:nitrogen permease regulator 2-domain-containing protein [Neurospora tetraspora]
MIQAIFYARFFPKEGTKIVAQSPPGSIVPVPLPEGTNGPLNRKPCLFDFSVLQEYIIPRKAFCNRFITVNDPDGKYVILGYPVSIPDPRYDRNEFIFNFGLVISCDVVDQIPYERVVRRLAATFAEMEKQDGYLSQDAATRGGAVAVHGYGNGGGRWVDGDGNEMVNDANTINMKLFPHHVNPPEVKGWHVPVAKMKFADVVNPTWDLTLQRVVAHIDGVSDVRRIALASGVSLELTQLALRHLLYYDTILLLDMFFFGACYAPRPGIHDFIANVGGMVDECANYVCVGPIDPSPGSNSNSTGTGTGPSSSSDNHHRLRSVSGSTTFHNHNPSNLSTSASTRHSHLSPSGLGPGGSDRDPSPYAQHHLSPVHERKPSTSPRNINPHTSSSSPPPTNKVPPPNGYRISNYMLIRLITTFCVGKTVAEWLKGHMDSGFDVLRYVDVRRLVQFGVIKGCLYRVHKYVISKQYLAALATGLARPVSPSATNNTNGREKEREGGRGEREDNKVAVPGGHYDTYREPGSHGHGHGGKGANKKMAMMMKASGDPLQKYMDGRHCFDQIMTERNMTDAEIMDKLRNFPVPAGDLTVLYR